jgi:hypothetical protein
VQEAVVVAFTEESIANDAGLLEKCYVQTPERTKFDSRIKMYIAKREPVTPSSPRRPMKKDDRALVDLIGNTVRGQAPLAVLIIGLVGAGKTTFLNYTSNVSARALLSQTASRPTPHWIYVDYRDLAGGENSMQFLQWRLRDHISDDDFLSDYNRCIQHAYKRDVDALMRGPLYLLANDEVERKRRIAELIMKDHEAVTPYVEKILSYAAKNAPVFLVIDNVDQFEDEDFQAQIFSDAIALSRRVNANLVLAMRDATYVKHRALPILDAFDFDPIYIDPPVIDAVLSKRFFIARQILSGKSVDFVSENGVWMHIQDSAIVIDLIQGSVLGTEVGEMIDVLAGSDVRLALRMTREFLQYGYSSTGVAISTYKNTGRFQLPKHEALRGIMLGNQSIYNSAHSVIRNPFDAQLARSDAQLLRLYILSALVNFGSEASFGGLAGEEIRKSLRTIGFGDETTKKVLDDLVDARLIATTTHKPAAFESAFIPTRLGGHIVRHFIANFAFLENVMMDTFISDDVVWEDLRREVQKIYEQRDRMRRMEFRVNAVNLFYDYLSERFSLLTDESIRRGLRREWCVNPFSASQSQFNSNVAAVLRSAQRNR